MQVALFGGASNFFAAGRARCVAATGGERLEDGVEMADGIVFAADHLAIAALESPNAAARADIHIVNAFRREFLGAANVVDVVGVAAVDDDVAGLKLRSQVVQRGVDDAGGHHEPDSARLREFLYEIVERRRTYRTFRAELLHGIGAAVEDNALVTIFLQAAHHVGAHPAETDHAELHSFAPVPKLGCRIVGRAEARPAATTVYSLLKALHCQGFLHCFGELCQVRLYIFPDMNAQGTTPAF